MRFNLYKDTVLQCIQSKTAIKFSKTRLQKTPLSQNSKCLNLNSSYISKILMSIDSKRNKKSKLFTWQINDSICQKCYLKIYIFIVLCGSVAPGQKYKFAFKKTLAPKNILLMHSLRGFLFCTPFVISIKEVVASMFYTRTIIIASRFVLFVCLF